VIAVLMAVGSKNQNLLTASSGSAKRQMGAECWRRCVCDNQPHPRRSPHQCVGRGTGV